ncbi:MAG: L-ribulose-5-phosphate 4-epimerase AraD [Verrucomicrobia bacterium]|nr:L-ribulose-5-phosphate 4-epimerase AraD [Verrucomicrobiota bacterium]
MNYHELKSECYQANLLLPEYKLIDLTFGNVSVCDRGQRVLAIKPSGVDYAVLQADDIVVLDFNGTILEGKLRPSSDTPTHLRLFQAFTGIRAIVHTHSRNAVAFAQAGIPIPCFGTTHADYFYGSIPVTRPMNIDEVNSGYELQTGNVIVERFKDLDPLAMRAVLVHGHGPFAWGASGQNAVENALALEIVAEIALKTIQLKSEAGSISQHLLDKHYLRKHGEEAYYGQLR